MRCIGKWGLLAILIVCWTVASVSARTWNFRNGGASVEAELLDVRGGNVVLKKQDGAEMTVPLNQLSLGDLRYVRETLHAAEAAVTDGVPSSNPPAEKTPAASTPKAMTDSAVDVSKLHYQWKKGQSYVYRIRIKGDRGYYSEYYAGDVTYTVKSTHDDETVLSMSADMKRGDRLEPINVFMLIDPGLGRWGRAVRVRVGPSPSKEVLVTLDNRGKVEHLDGNAQLPFLLGDLSQLMIEPLPAAGWKQSRWTVANDTGVNVIGTFYPYYRFWGLHYHEGVPATEKTVYTILDQNEKQTTIAKHYELTTGDESIKGKPRFKATGDGRWEFDTVQGLPSRMDFNLLVTVRDANRTEEAPVHITYRLLSDQEIAEAKKDAEEAKKKAELAKKERLRPLTDKEINVVLDDLASDDEDRINPSLKRLIEKKPKTPNIKIAKALESLMLTGESPVTRGDAATALKHWATPDNVPGLIKALRDDWPPVQNGAIGALCRVAPKEAIPQVAALLSQGGARGDAVKYLRAAGPDAEDAVLAQLAASSDAWTKADICKILGDIGTEKSIPKLQQAVSDANWMVNGNARKALSAVKARVGFHSKSPKGPRK